MSTGYECYFTEVSPGEWFYVLQNGDCPVGAWDWREYATAYGPFETVEKAQKHLSDHHANPGGWSTDEWQDGKSIDETEERLFAKARERQKVRGW